MKILGIDYGNKKIGLALGDENLKLAVPLKSLCNDGSVYSKISNLVKRYEVKRVVIGLPLTLKGNEGQRAREVKDFSNKLAAFLPEDTDILFWDERFTTQEAYRYLESYSWKRKKEHKDSVSAYIILSEYLESV